MLRIHVICVEMNLRYSSLLYTGRVWNEFYEWVDSESQTEKVISVQ